IRVRKPSGQCPSEEREAGARRGRQPRASRRRKQQPGTESFELSRQPGSCSAGHAGCERKPSRGVKSAETSQRACEAGNCPSCFQETLVILEIGRAHV